MRRIVLLDNEDGYEFLDSQRIVAVMREAGFVATDIEARWLWKRYSDSMCAQWMRLPETDADVLGAIRSYFRVR